MIKPAAIAIALALATPAHADPIELADGKYASAEDYVVGIAGPVRVDVRWGGAPTPLAKTMIQ